MEITSILLSVPEHKRQDVYDEWVQMARQRKSGKTRRHMRSSVENYDPGAVAGVMIRFAHRSWKIRQK